MTRSVFLLVYDGVELLDIAGPLSVFSKVNDIAPNSYEIRVITLNNSVAVTNSNISVNSSQDINKIQDAEIDILLVPGCSVDNLSFLKHKSTSIFNLCHASKRVVSVCTGVFLLASSNVLEAQRCTTHWDSCDELRNNFPKLLVDFESIFVQDGKYWSSAGMLAAIDMCLAIVEEDFGHDVAMSVAKILISPGKRAGDSKQFSDLLILQSSSKKRFDKLIFWISQNLDKELSLEKLAEKMSMSPRNLSRNFKNEFNTTPVAYVKELRLAQARELLLSTRLSIEIISEKCGFQSIDAFQRNFYSKHRLTPNKFRQTSIK